jgi:hypothetical protein
MLKNSKLLTLSLFFVFGNCFTSDDSGEGRPFSPRELRPNSFTPVSPALLAALSRGSVSLDDLSWADLSDLTPVVPTEYEPTALEKALKRAAKNAAKK